MTEGGGILRLNGRSFRLRRSGYGSICIIQGNDPAKDMSLCPCLRLGLWRAQG